MLVPLGYILAIEEVFLTVAEVKVISVASPVDSWASDNAFVEKLFTSPNLYFFPARVNEQ